MRQIQYSSIDRVFFRLVLGSKTIQCASFDLQRLLCPKSSPSLKPVFVVGMARSGTTTLLNILHSTENFRSCQYHDLPFPLSPALWRRIRSPFTKNLTPAIRAHGDGIMISPNSPEAFEEVFWKFVAQELTKNKTFEAFQDYINLVSNSEISPKRYLSKNNGNLVRLELLSEFCKSNSGIILVPIRNPVHTAQSSLRMHILFSELQQADPFVLDFMNYLGHREFGLGHAWQHIGSRQFKPTFPITSLECWVEYWCYLHQELLNIKSPFLRFVDFDALRNSPLNVLTKILSACHIDVDPNRLLHLITPDVQGAETPQIDRKVYNAALEIVQEYKASVCL